MLHHISYIRWEILMSFSRLAKSVPVQAMGWQILMFQIKQHFFCSELSCWDFITILPYSRVYSDTLVSEQHCLLISFLNFCQFLNMCSFSLIGFIYFILGHKIPCFFVVYYCSLIYKNISALLVNQHNWLYQIFSFFNFFIVFTDKVKRNIWYYYEHKHKL